jgi:ribosome-associated toxin RatA of RatAB toxin-antitoxin module
MPLIKRAKQVPYGQAEMYALVNDIATYPKFVPWCTSSEIIRSEPDLIEARLTFSKGGLERSFTTLNRLQPDKMIEIKLVDGPFDHLEGFWRFEPRGTGCMVILDLNFEFNNRVTQLVFGGFFNQIASMLVDTFCERADDLHEGGSCE